jgi:uncharacterized protein (TIGR02246 family)
MFNNGGFDCALLHRPSPNPRKLIMKIIFLSVFLIMAFGMLYMGQSQSQSQTLSTSLSLNPDNDIAEIVALQEEQAAAWNRRDAAGYARLFIEDGDVVNVLGWWWKGRDEIERKLTDAYAFVFSESKLEITDVHVRLLDSGYAVAHVLWTMDGAKSPPGSPAPPREGIQLQVLQKTPEGWRIVSFQNTNSMEEVPFPTSPPGITPVRQ